MANAVGLMRAAVRRGDRVPAEARRTYPSLGLALMLGMLGEFGEAGRLIDAANDRIERTGDSLWAAAPTIFRARIQLAACRLDDAVAEANVGLAIAEELGTPLYTPSRDRRWPPSRCFAGSR